MSEAIKEKEELVIEEVKELDAKIGDVVTEKGTGDDEELFVVEEVETDEESTKSDKDTDTELEDEKSKSKDVDSDDTKEDSATARSIKILERKIKNQDKLLKNANLTESELLARTPLPDMKADIVKQRDILANLDEYVNPNEYDIQKKVVATLEGNIAEKERSEEVMKRFNSKDNAAFLETEKKSLADKGFKFSDVEWEAIAEEAETYLVDGKYTKESIQKSLTDILGAEQVDKMYSVGAEQKVRKDLKDATAKVTKSVRVTRDGVNVRLVPLTKRLLAITDPDELDRALNALSPDQYAIFKKARDSQKK